MVLSNSKEKFVINWDEFAINACETIRKLHTDTHFTDVTFVCDDGEQIPAHKIILSSCSKVFSNILTKAVHKNTLMYFNGISHRTLLQIVDFIYLGKVEIESDDLDKFLQWGRNLKIDGLSTFESTEVINGQKNEDETKQMMDKNLLKMKKKCLEIQP